MTGFTEQAYSPVAKSMHWLIVALVTAQYATALIMPEIERDTQPDTVINLHFSLGILIVAVMAVRLVHRLSHPVPLEVADSSALERLLAKTTHRLIYLLLLLAPPLGWAAASAHRLPVNLFGVLPLPALATPGARWALLAGDIHAVAMWTLLVLITLHIVAALYHHLVRHDNTLKRMLPSLR